jgi:hypothetical protein
MAEDANGTVISEDPRADIPAWANPGPLMFNAGVRVTDFPAGAVTDQQVARADPRRIAIGFATIALFNDEIVVTPYIPGDGLGWRVSGRASDCWFHLLSHGPLVNQPWFQTQGVGLALRVFEVYQLG